MAEYKADGEDTEACLVKETPAPSLWEKETMQACSSIRVDGTQAMHAITLIANTAILIQTGVRHDWDFAVSQKETRNDVTLRDFPLTIAYPQNIGDYTLHAISVSSIAILLSLTDVTMLKCSEKQIRDHWSMLCFFYSYVSACFVVMEEPCQRKSFRFWTIVYSIVIATCMVGNAFGLTLQGVGAQVCLYASSNVVIMSHVTHV